ncbi:MAG: hypothetical protein KVP17_001636 [Porospora cf. gigantea B]|uniref:uncharacterized protein n=1 Tax=Porospora cf. gigantea B TaxID=2853592 RepID=UPI003571BD8D|nr:MAG: hypothetical protein KVP17_001636 [Porospora cf. gigantea B]
MAESQDAASWVRDAYALPPSISLILGGFGCLNLLIAGLLTPQLAIFVDTWRRGRARTALAGARSRSSVILALFVGNASRAASAFACIFLSSHYAEFWIIEGLLNLPSLVFLTSFSLIVLFWTQIYNGANLSSSSVPLGAVLVINATAWTLLISLFGVALWLQAAAEYLVVYNALLGLFLLLPTVLIFVYGIKVVRKFPPHTEAEPAIEWEQYKKRSRVVKRVISMSLLVPLCLLVGSFLCFGMCYRAVTEQHIWPMSNQLLWLILFWLATEITPSLVVINSMWPREDTDRQQVAVPNSSTLFGDAVERNAHLLQGYEVEWAQ